MEDGMNSGGLFVTWAVGPFDHVAAGASGSLLKP
jgi:hypothetical protein